MTADARTRSFRQGVVAFALILLVATLAMPLFTSAMEIRSDESVTVAANEIVNNDLFVAANTFTLAGNANLDVAVLARDAVFNGSVGGALNVAAATVTIDGNVAGSVRIAAGTATISGSIGGDLLVLGGTVTIEPSAVIRGDVTVQSGTLTTRGTIQGDLSGSVERLSVDGTIVGDVSVRTADLDIEPGGAIEGDLSYVSGADADIATDATVAGSVDKQTIAPWGADQSLRGRFFSPLVRTLWMLVAGAAIVVLAPRMAAALDANMRRPIATLIAGIAALIAIPVLVVVLAITIIGLPVSLILLGLYLAGLYLSQVVVGQRLGTLILPNRWNDGSRGYLLLSMTIGVLLLSLLRYLPIPYVGNLVHLVVAITGLGAAVLLIGQLRPNRFAATSAGA